MTAHNIIITRYSLQKAICHVMVLFICPSVRPFGPISR